MHSLSLLARTFQRILVSMDNNEIGRPGFGISEILALYKVGGKREVSIACLNMRIISKGDNLELHFLKCKFLYSKTVWTWRLVIGGGRDNLHDLIQTDVIIQILAESNDNSGRSRLSNSSANKLRAHSHCM